MSPIQEGEYRFGKEPNSWKRVRPHWTVYQIEREDLQRECQDKVDNIITNVSVLDESRVEVKEKVKVNLTNGHIYNQITHKLNKEEVNYFFDQRNMIPSDKHNLRFKTLRWVPEEEMHHYNTTNKARYALRQLGTLFSKGAIFFDKFFRV